MSVKGLLAEQAAVIKELKMTNNALSILIIKQQCVLKSLFDTFEIANNTPGANLVQMMQREIKEVKLVDSVITPHIKGTSMYMLANQYPKSSAELGEVVRLSLHGEYCPDNSMRGYTREEIENNPNWLRII